MFSVGASWQIPNAGTSWKISTATGDILVIIFFFRFPFQCAWEHVLSGIRCSAHFVAIGSACQRNSCGRVCFVCSLGLCKSVGRTQLRFWHHWDDFRRLLLHSSSLWFEPFRIVIVDFPHLLVNRCADEWCGCGARYRDITAVNNAHFRKSRRQCNAVKHLECVTSFPCFTA